MPAAVGQASLSAGSGGFQPRVGVRLPRHSRILGQEAPKTGRLEAYPTKYLGPIGQTLVGLRSGSGFRVCSVFNPWLPISGVHARAMR